MANNTYRTRNSVLNMLTSTAGQLLVIILRFVNGIASELVDLCKEWGVKNNLQTLIWTTAYNNEAAIATAEKNAFRKADYIKFNSVQHPSIRLVLWLDKSVRNCWKLSVYYCIRKYYVSLLNQV